MFRIGLEWLKSGVFFFNPGFGGGGGTGTPLHIFLIFHDILCEWFLHATEYFSYVFDVL